MELQKIITESGVENQLQLEVKELIEEANSIIVSNDNELSYATDILKLLKGQQKTVEEERTKITAPLNSVLTHVNARFKKLSTPLIAAEVKIKGLTLNFIKAKQQKELAAQLFQRQQAEKKARAEAEILRALNKTEEAKELEIHANEVAAAPQQAIKQTILGGVTGAKISIKKVWKFKVVDIQKLAEAHPEFILPNSVAINTAITAGKIEIAGLEITQDEITSIR